MMISPGTLRTNEVHPSARSALAFVQRMPQVEQALWLEAFTSTALEGNRTSEILGETLRRVMHGEPVSDRYLLGLAWFLQSTFSVPQLAHTRLLKELADAVIDDNNVVGPRLGVAITRAREALKGWEDVL